jgi:subtilisin-like proprotein convertase family protein
VAAASVLFTGLHLAVHAQVFVNNTPINIPAADTSGPADVFPSSINVSGLGTSLTGITLDLFGYSHEFSPDVQILVESPQGTRVLLMGLGSGGLPQPSINLTFDDAASGFLPMEQPITSGSYKPTLHNPTPSAFEAPGPTDTGSWTTTLSSFHGENPNGVWKLWAEDFATQDVGSISGGWGVNMTAVPEPHEYAMMAAVGLGVFAVVRRRRASR